MMTNIAGQTVLVTGGNRGIGRALVEEALGRGARRVYVSTRGRWAHSDERVTPLAFDLTDRAAIRAAAGAVGSLDLLVNNLSLNALAPLPMIPAYSLSKAAGFSLTQSLRSLLAARGIRVHGARRLSRPRRNGQEAFS
jgi:NAD(P)-dependent dehydrogenase (short-subunit alcohol dehydrogenase family)